MKQKILFMTVGTGYGEEGYKRLAEGLCSSITYNCPSKVVFFVTEQSIKTLDYLKKVYYEKEEDELDQYDFVKINNPDDFNNCYEIISDKVNEYSKNNIVIDYTSGTKTMSVVIAVIGIINHFPLVSIIGNRGNLGVITPNTEENKSQNPYQVYDKLNFNNFKKHFNNNRFDSAEDSLNKIVSLFDEDTHDTLILFTHMYKNWDKFHHTKCNFNKKNEIFGDFKQQLGLNAGVLGIITDKKGGLTSYYLLADIISNARRRYLEERYDDAVARLYSSLELIARIRLDEYYDIKTSNVQLDSLEKYAFDEYYLDELEKNRKYGKIKLGLRDSYKLLSKIGDDLGIYYMENENLYKSVLNERNDSILAHGTTPVLGENYSQFEELVLNLAKILDTRIEKFIEETEFPKFKI